METVINEKNPSEPKLVRCETNKHVYVSFSPATRKLLATMLMFNPDSRNMAASQTAPFWSFFALRSARDPLFKQYNGSSEGVWRLDAAGL